MSCIYLSWLISHLLQVLWRNREGGEAALKNNRLTYFLIFFGLLATEIVIAAKNPDPEEIKYEIADFLYHVMVLMAVKDVSWEDIIKELANR